MLRVIGALLALLVACSVQATPLDLPASFGRLDLASHIRFLEDREGSLGIADVRNETAAWSANGADVFNQSYSDSAWWLKLQLANPGEEEREKLIELAYAVLDYVDVYIYSGELELAHYQLGDKHSYLKRPIDHHFFLIPLDWTPGETLDVYLRIQSSSAVQAPLTLWDRAEFASFDSTRSILQGLFFGTLLVIGAYNLLLFFALGDRNYLYYVGYVLCMPLFLASLGGQAFRYLWPTATSWNDQAILVFLSGVVLFSCAFAHRFLKAPEVSRPLAYVLRFLGACGVVAALLAFVLPYALGIRVVIVLASVTCVFVFMAGCYCWWHGVSSARYYTIAWTSMYTGGVVMALSKFGFIPSSVLTEYGTHIGASLEVVLLSFALAERINSERRLRYDAQAEALRATQRANSELEQRVRERTRELEDLNQKLQVLSNTDQLTGLKNRRFLERRLNEEWTRCHRYRRQLAVVLVDIDFFKRVNDTYGHPAGDACLQEVARRIRSCLRWPGDEVARFGGEEFCLVLPETDAEGALAVTERLRATVEREPVIFESLRLELTISAGVCAGIPTAETGPERMIKQADLALYSAKEQGRNRVLLFASEAHERADAQDMGVPAV